jgi:hypothetical protein
MPFVVNAAKQVMIGSFDATSFSTGATWGVDVESLDVTTLADVNFHKYTTGLRTLNISLPGFNDYAVAAINEWARAALPSEQVVSLAYNGITVGSAVVSARGLLRSMPNVAASAGQVPTFTLDFPSSQSTNNFDGLLTQATATNITATGNTTPVQAGALVPAQTIAAAIHIAGYTGTGTVTFQLQSSPTSGGTYTARGTATAALNAVGGTWVSATNLTVTDTWWRLAVTASASPVATVFASIGIITP